MSFDHPALSVRRLAKCFRIYDHPRDRLLQTFLGNRRRLYREFWALRDISFDLPAGNTIGIVGRNGSGKSTLLQLICGTLTPTHGSVLRQGRIGALLELGSGFNPEFTGRENIYLNGAILGLSKKQIDEKIDAILSFADIGDFIDQPVKTYSSGMAIRLAFAVQAHCDPEILVVDEALAVGDELFQKKCYSHLEGLKEMGTAILLVTHSCPQINQQCDSAILLHKGVPRLMGEPHIVTTLYQQLMNAPDEEWEHTIGLPAGDGRPTPVSDLPAYPRESPTAAIVIQDSETGSLDAEAGGQDIHAHRAQASFDPALKSESTIIYPTHGARICSVEILSLDGDIVNIIPSGDPFSIRIRYQAEEDLASIRLGCHIASHTGSRITGQIMPLRMDQGLQFPAGSEWQMCCDFQGCLWPGVYFVGAGIINTLNPERKFVHRVIDFAVFRIVPTAFLQQVGVANLAHAPGLIQPLQSSVSHTSDGSVGPGVEQEA